MMEPVTGKESLRIYLPLSMWQIAIFYLLMLMQQGMEDKFMVGSIIQNLVILLVLWDQDSIKLQIFPLINGDVASSKFH